MCERVRWICCSAGSLARYAAVSSQSLHTRPSIQAALHTHEQWLGSRITITLCYIVRAVETLLHSSIGCLALPAGQAGCRALAAALWLPNSQAAELWLAFRLGCELF